MTRLIAALLLCLCVAPLARGQDVAFLAAPRTTGKFATQSLSEGEGPYRTTPAQLIVRNAEGFEKVLADNVLDFSVAWDAKSLLVTILDGYSIRPDRVINYGTANVWRVDIATGVKTQLTFNTEVGVWACQPIEFNGGICYLSNEDNWQNPHETYRAFTEYAMGYGGEGPRRIWDAGLGGTFGHTTGKDGWIYFASGENQGFNGGRGNVWSILKIRPDGSGFEPEQTSVKAQQGDVFDWVAMTSDGSLVSVRYYDTRIYGTFVALPPFDGSTPFADGPTKFGFPAYDKNPHLRNGFDPTGKVPNHTRYAWQPKLAYALTPNITSGDWESKQPFGDTVELSGMVTHPAPIPGNGVYFTWTGDEGDALMDLGVYAIPDVKKEKAPQSKRDFVLVVDKPDRHEWLGKPIVPIEAIYGLKPPAVKYTPTDELPPGSPLAIVGSSSMDRPEVVDGQAFVSKVIHPNGVDPAFVRILLFNPTLHYTPQTGIADKMLNGGIAPYSNFEGFGSEINERVAILGEVPLWKWGDTPTGPVKHYGPNPPAGLVRTLRSDGRPDTSWKAAIPADQPWAPQSLNEKREAITYLTAETWHKNCPREVRTDCQGCHQHNQPDQIPFAATDAGKPSYPMPTFAHAEVVVRQRDLDPAAPVRPWGPNHYLKWKPIAGLARTYDSSLSTLDDDPALTPEQNMKRRFWIDTGMLEAGTIAGVLITPESGKGPYADTNEPTVNVEVDGDQVAIGALDPQAGLKSLTVNGVDKLADLDPQTHILHVPRVAGLLTVVAIDKHNNKTTRETFISGGPPSDPPTAVYFARDVDWIGLARISTPDGVRDHHARITGLPPSSKYVQIEIKGTPDYKWSSSAGAEGNPNFPPGGWPLVVYVPRIITGDVLETGPLGELDIAWSEQDPAVVHTDFRAYMWPAGGGPAIGPIPIHQLTE